MLVVTNDDYCVCRFGIALTDADSYCDILWYND